MTHLILLLTVLLQNPGFYPDPPEEAPEFKHWGENAAQWTNVAKTPKAMEIPSGIDLREYLNEQGVCRKNGRACTIRIVYEFTINAHKPEDATLAVVRYIIWSNIASTQTCSWVDVGRDNQRYFVLEDQKWSELPDGPASLPVRKMTNTILHRGMKILAPQEQ